MKTIFNIDYNSPIIFTAIHSGDQLSEICMQNMKLPKELRFMEEDPFTEIFATLHSNNIIQPISRFEIDLNRNRKKSVYLKPQDCWGLEARIKPPSEKQIQLALDIYDNFYKETFSHLKKVEKKFGNFFIFDFHSYNHHRLGVGQPFDDPEKNPEIIIGTSNMDIKWKPFVLALQKRMLEFNFMGRKLDVRINVKYPGGNFARQVHNSFPENGCVISLEFKKIFMEEWSGKLYSEEFEELKELIQFCKPVLENHFE